MTKPSQVNINWQEEIFQPKVLSRMQHLATNRFGDTTLAEEAYSASLEIILDPSWQQRKLSSYRGVASPTGYILSIFKRLLEDFSRKRFGRPRPPSWLKRLGTFYQRIFILLCLERLSPEHLIDKVNIEHPDHNVEKVTEAIAIIRLKIPRCGEQNGEINHDFNDEGNRTGQRENCRHTLEPEERLANDMLGNVFQSLAIMLGRDDGADADFTPLAQQATTNWQNLGEAVSLQPEDRLLLKMIYQDGLKVAAASRLLNEKDHIIRRRLRNIVNRLRKGLEEAGITADTIRGAL